MDIKKIEVKKDIYFLTPLFYREYINGSFNKEVINEAKKEFLEDKNSKSFIIKYMDYIVNFDEIPIKDKIKVLFFLSAVLNNEIIFIKEENPKIIHFF